MRLATALLLLLGLLPGGARAQGVAGVAIGSGTRGRGWVPLVGARYSNVQGLGGSLLLLHDDSRVSGERSGWFGATEVGVHGISASLGEGHWGSVSGGSFRATLLRTYGDRGRLAGGQNYLGGEARVSLVWASFGAGFYQRVTGDAPGDGSIFAFTVGFGY